MSERLNNLACCIAGIAAGFISCWLWVQTHPAAPVLKVENKAVKSVLKDERKAADISLAIGQQTALRQAQIHTETTEVIRLVPQFVSADVVQRYPLPNGFVRVVDAAITGDTAALSEPATEPDDAPSAVDAAEGAAILAQDFGTCRQAVIGYEGWNDWARRNGLIPKAEGR